MKEEIKIEITKQIGTADAPGLISKLEALGVSDDVLLYDRGVSIPAALVKDFESLQHELSTLSKANRTFPASIVDGRLQIDLRAMKASALTSYRLNNNIFTEVGGKLQIGTRTTLTRRPTSSRNTIFANADDGAFGISQEDFQLPAIPRGSKVLDIGAGTGYISRKIKDTFSADVYALEPSLESASDFDSCVEKLGADHVAGLTLQEALTRFPEKYSQAFDVVCVFKYNVPHKQKKDFIRALSQVVKPDGIVYVTSVEPSRFTYDMHAGEDEYLTNTFQKYFGNVSFETRCSYHGVDQLMTLDSPTPERRYKHSSDGPSHK